MNESPKFQLFINFLVVFISLSQAYNHWGDKQALAYFFLIGGVGILTATLFGIYRTAKTKKSNSSN